MHLINVDTLGVDKCNSDTLPAAYCEGWNAMVYIVNNAPTVDAVPVVRCKECSYRGTITCPMVHEQLGNGLLDYAHDDGYCSRGKRKENEYADD